MLSKHVLKVCDWELHLSGERLFLVPTINGGEEVIKRMGFIETWSISDNLFYGCSFVGHDYSVVMLLCKPLGYIHTP